MREGPAGRLNPPGPLIYSHSSLRLFEWEPGCSPAGRTESKVCRHGCGLREAAVTAPKRWLDGEQGGEWFSKYQASNGILCCLCGTRADNHHLNWCIVHYRTPPCFNRVSIMWNRETWGAKACTLTHVWRFNHTETASLFRLCCTAPLMASREEEEHRLLLDGGTSNHTPLFGLCLNEEGGVTNKSWQKCRVKKKGLGLLPCLTSRGRWSTTADENMDWTCILLLVGVL